MNIRKFKFSKLFSLVFFLCLAIVFLILSPVAKVYNVEGYEIDTENLKPIQKGYKTAPIPVFMGSDKDLLPKSLSSYISLNEKIYYKSPSMTVFTDKNEKQSVIAAAVKSSSGGAYGTGEIVVKKSEDNGLTWDSERTVFKLPVRQKPNSNKDYAAAFNSECLIFSADGEIILMTIMYPESKGPEDKTWIENADVYKQIGDVLYPVLYDEPSSVGKTISAAVPQNEYTVREDGFVYTPDGKKTAYYLPQFHSPEYAYQTMGDMYYCVGEPDYKTTPPPLLPEYKPGTERDIYVGNIYLSENKPSFSLNEPIPVTKKKNGGIVEASPAPLRAPVTANIFVLKSRDGGESFSQPVNITYQIKGKADKGILSFASSSAVVLKNQVYYDKNGRIIVFFKNSDGVFAVYSDNNADMFKRRQVVHFRNAEFSACFEDEEGSLISLSSKKKSNKVKAFESIDSGVKWNRDEPAGIPADGAALSALRLPVDYGKENSFKYADGMELGREYIIVAHSIKDSGKDTAVLTIGALNPKDRISWNSEKKLNDDEFFSSNEKYNSFIGQSSLTVLENGNIGILYESSPASLILFRQFSLEWIINGASPKIKTETPPLIILLMLAIGLSIILLTLYAAVKALLKKCSSK